MKYFTKSLLFTNFSSSRWKWGALMLCLLLLSHVLPTNGAFEDVSVKKLTKDKLSEEKQEETTEKSTSNGSPTKEDDSMFAPEDRFAARDYLKWKQALAEAAGDAQGYEKLIQESEEMRARLNTHQKKSRAVWSKQVDEPPTEESSTPSTDEESEEDKNVIKIKFGNPEVIQIIDPPNAADLFTTRASPSISTFKKEPEIPIDLDPVEPKGMPTNVYQP